jgi:hypothetical protein
MAILATSLYIGVQCRRKRFLSLGFLSIMAKTDSQNNLWDIEAKIRLLLERGVDVGHYRVGAKIEPDVTWIKMDVASRQIVVIYVKGQVEVDVKAVLLDNGDVKISSVTFGRIHHKDLHAGLL